MTMAFRGIGEFDAINQQVAEAMKASKQKNIDYSKTLSQTSLIAKLMADNFQKSSNSEVKEPVKIGTGRVIFHRLKDEQIEEINQSRQLPKNAKIVDSPNGLTLSWNLIDFTQGTHKLPAGYELKKDILGFTHVVREDSKAWFLKK